MLSSSAVPIIIRCIEPLKLNGEAERVKIDNIEFVITPPVQSGEIKKSIGVGVASAISPEDGEVFLIVHCGVVVSQEKSVIVLPGASHNSYGPTGGSHHRHEMARGDDRRQGGRGLPRA